MPVSVDGVHSPSLLRYWPNPAHNLIQLELPAEFENASVRFIDVSGRMHRSWEGLHSGIHPLDISGLASGIYVVQIQSGFNTQNIKIILE